MPLAVNSTEPRARVFASTFLLARRHAILARAQASLRARATRYHDGESDAVHARLDAVLTYLVEAVAGGDLRHLLEHTDAVAEARFHTGFGLGDVQAAYNALEEAVWDEALDGGSLERYVSVLPLVSGALGAAKDELARDYVGLAAAARAPSVDVAALFRGLERP